jgi:cyanophycin synthetase
MDVTELVHPDNIFMAERIARIVGLDICGMDIISQDIGVPFRLNRGAVVEVNSGPGFRLHMEPTEGKPRNVAGSVIDMLFPAGCSSRVPIIAVTGAYNKTNVCDLVAHLMGKLGYKVGCATSKGIQICNSMVLQEDATDYNHAEMVLKDPTIDLAVFECALPGILGTGLAFYNCDIGIVTGLDYGGADQGGGEMRRAAAVVPGCVLPSGYAILSADDEMVYRMHQGLECKFAYFSMNADNPYITGHIQNGGIAAIVEDGYITICEGRDKTGVIRVSDIAGAGTEVGAEARDPFLIRHVLAFVLVGSIYRIPMEVVRGVLGNMR